MEKFSRVKALVDLDAVAYNFEAMHKNIKPGTKMIAVVKADAYGHGAVPIARLVQDYDYIWGFAVATEEEALSLREAGIRKPILVLGLVFPECMEELAKNDISIAVSSISLAREYAKAGRKLSKTVKIHLAVDTGMTRIGFHDGSQSLEEIKNISKLPYLEIEGMFTHFARADEYDVSPAKTQLDRFLAFASILEKNGIHIPMKHCSNSAGLIRMQEANLDAVRAGITIYGVYPSQQVEKHIVELKPVMELKSHVSFVKKITKGTAVSYGGTFIAPKDMQLATIPVGYADGYSRQLSGKGWVLIHGKKAPICGRVCMDQFMVDVTEIPGVKTGDEVTLLGKDGQERIDIDTLGDLSGRFSYEFLCQISSRVPRVYIGKQ